MAFSCIYAVSVSISLFASLYDTLKHFIIRSFIRLVLSFNIKARVISFVKVCTSFYLFYHMRVENSFPSSVHGFLIISFISFSFSPCICVYLFCIVCTSYAVLYTLSSYTSFNSSSNCIFLCFCKLFYKVYCFNIEFLTSCMSYFH